ncbi:unnamed protein product [Soboliphyme baturini]|uniref:MARVEL domain-containing protein n=1 Tax=Soboliphyme baturini TaxID=241478 RepID=A0A183INQ5_9BILA|nr:unnamed protein product [Soboliphyme baturini]
MTLRFDFAYICSWPYGLLRLAQIVFCIIVLICLSSSEVSLSGSGYIYGVNVIALISSLVALILYILHLPETGFWARVPWRIGECISCAIWALCEAVSLIIAAVHSSRYSSVIGNMSACYGAAAVTLSIDDLHSVLLRLGFSCLCDLRLPIVSRLELNGLHVNCSAYCYRYIHDV